MQKSTEKHGEMTRTACYIRVSTQEQKLHGISLDSQRDKLKEYAETHNLKIVEWYEDEGVSGRKLIKQRPELQRMLNDAHAGKFDRIIFIKLDRFFRSVAEYHECMKYIEPVVWTATEEKYDLSTANGRAFVNMKLTIAELEADQTGERIKIVNDYKIKTGQALTGAHNQGLAFTVQNIDGVKRVVPDPETKDMINDYINQILTYNSKRQAMLYINQKYNTDYSFNSLANLLCDTKLYGYYKGNENYCEPYIDKATFDKLQDINNNSIKVPKTKKIYLFTGLIKCPVCGNKLAGGSSTHRATKKPSGKVYTYDNPILSYRCNKYRKDKQCSFSKALNEKKLEKKLIDSLDIFMTSYISDVQISEVKETINTAADQIKQIKSEMARLNNMYRKERISETEYDKEYEILETRLKELESQLEPAKERDLTIYQELLKSDWKDLYNALTKENKRAFWRKYVKTIEIDENGQFIQPIFF